MISVFFRPEDSPGRKKAETVFKSAKPETISASSPA